MAPRWVAAAAAAGLFVGVGVGMFFDPTRSGRVRQHAQAATAPTEPVTRRRQPS